MDAEERRQRIIDVQARIALVTEEQRVARLEGRYEDATHLGVVIASLNKQRSRQLAGDEDAFHHTSGKNRVARPGVRMHQRHNSQSVVRRSGGLR